jgi:hypothetical protein
MAQGKRRNYCGSRRDGQLTPRLIKQQDRSTNWGQLDEVLVSSHGHLYVVDDVAGPQHIARGAR